jgi:hypothetical protein
VLLDFQRVGRSVSLPVCYESESWLSAVSVFAGARVCDGWRPDPMGRRYPEGSRAQCARERLTALPSASCEDFSVLLRSTELLTLPSPSAGYEPAFPERPREARAG